MLQMRVNHIFAGTTRSQWGDVDSETIAAAFINADLLDSLRLQECWRLAAVLPHGVETEEVLGSVHQCICAYPLA